MLQNNRGETRLGKSKAGSAIHLVRVRAGTRLTDAVVPECKYNQKQGAQKTAFGPGSSVTENTGVRAAEEVINWSFGAGVLRICPTCNNLLSPGMQTILGAALGEPYGAGRVP